MPCEHNNKYIYKLFFRIFSYLDVVSLCRCAQVSRAWNVLALDGSNWQKIDLFDFQTDVEVYFILVNVYFFVLQLLSVIIK